ncbi:hypothetical protein BS47DRAFT_348517 [Hydnum rufescens UP504]|uniref:Uncharacterized protein n=1 Tax=Hydnum rufescens UP504 TaxID=1448309 RepID=A0A9P6AKA6_9AGAM|nr:hypothetical protein BS47DRAFT_348517 [Hydnum rufescens UP504]
MRGGVLFLGDLMTLDISGERKLLLLFGKKWKVPTTLGYRPSYGWRGEISSRDGCDEMSKRSIYRCISLENNKDWDRSSYRRMGVGLIYISFMTAIRVL